MKVLKYLSYISMAVIIGAMMAPRFLRSSRELPLPSAPFIIAPGSLPSGLLPLLSIHVLSMMLSYTLFGLVAFNGVMGLSVRSKEAGIRLRDLSLVLLYPAVFLLTFATFLGAVWANISWGSYWAWDPKETWALVTMLVYSFTLHGDVLTVFSKPRFFHWYTIIAFLSVLITYFGVNLLLGGMHSYA